MPFWKKAGTIGLDIDSNLIRVVALQGSSSSPVISHIGRIPLPTDAVREGVIHNVPMVAEVLHDYWEDKNLSTENIVIGLANNGVRIRTASFPKLPMDKLAKVIRYQSEDFFPIPLAQLVLDFTVIGETTGERGAMHHVLLVAARREELNKSIQAVTDAGLYPAVVDLSVLSLTRLVPQETASYIVVDIAYGVACFLLVDGEIPKICRVIPHGVLTYIGDSGQTLDRVLSSNSTLDTSDAQSISPSTGNETAVDEWALILANELRTTLSYYSVQPGARAIQKVYLSGLGSRIQGIPEIISEDLELPVEILTPFRRLKLDSSIGSISVHEESEFAVAVGLALRGMEG
ncbi:type IV pilus assembly protein PilM [Heliobacterium mobile]|nr:type IV pilus assembly protein PilM [Heliobacterium mobile]